MSAEILRRAAALMRERAEATDTGVYWFEATPDFVSALRENSGTTSAEADAEHIASWHPAVALAVADWLDSAASGFVEGEPLIDAALVAARAYLGESA